MAGRIKFSEELLQAVLDHIRNGASMEAACGAMGLGPDWLWHCRKRAEDGKEPWAKYLRELQSAKDIARVNAERRVFEGKGAWCAAARWLESHYAEQWRRVERLEHHQHGEIILRFADLSAEERARLSAKRKGQA